MSDPLDPKAAYARTQKLFLDARELTGVELGAFLDETCGEDKALRSELEVLLQHDRKNRESQKDSISISSRVREDLEALLDSTEMPSEPVLPEFVAEYSIRRRLGEGGMGTVYEAFQERMHRTVALKVLRAGSLSAQAERRFEHEGEFLGRLEHPGIGRIYDSGRAETAFGLQPFFAMELIKGEPLMDYAKHNCLEVAERLELIARVADAVQHAHQEGVIHRDLKPDNILVDNSGQPKILDFGIARASDLDTQRTTQQTFVGQILGTLAYMSPEQASGDPASIDERTDVYALGVLLYELLTGQLPLDVSTRSLPEALRVIQDDEPRRPSTLRSTLRGDVETIVRKTLEKDKERRYASAAALAVDLRHFLQHEPIEARPSSQLYVLSKFVRRNKVIVVATLLVLISLVANVSVLMRNGELDPKIALADDVSWRLELSYEEGVGVEPHSVAIGDLNGDGFLDVVTANQGSDDVSVLLGVGDGSVHPVKRFKAGDAPRSVAIADLNDDGFIDLVTANELSGNVSVLLGIGNSSFSEPEYFEVGKRPFGVAIGDLDGNGILDLVTANTQSRFVSVLLGLGDGSFRDAQSVAVGDGPHDGKIDGGYGCRSIAIADLNGDDAPELVIANPGQYSIVLLMGAGDGSFPKRESLMLNYSPQSVAIADLDGNGFLDLVTANFDSDNVSVLLGHGDGSFREAQPFAVGDGPRQVQIGDLDGDGFPDIVSTNQYSVSVSVLVGAGDGSFAQARPFSVAATPLPGVNRKKDWRPLAGVIGDMDDDGTLDVVVANYYEATVSILLNQP